MIIIRITNFPFHLLLAVLFERSGLCQGPLEFGIRRLFSLASRTNVSSSSHKYADGQGPSIAQRPHRGPGGRFAARFLRKSCAQVIRANGSRTP